MSEKHSVTCPDCGKMYRDFAPEGDPTCQCAEKAVRAMKAAMTDATKPGADRDPFIGVLASLAAAISLLERAPAAKKAAPSDKMFAQMIDDYKRSLEAGRASYRAAPSGLATKPDGGAKDGSSPILADKEDKRPREHGMIPVGDIAEPTNGTEVGPSGPAMRAAVELEILSATPGEGGE